MSKNLSESIESRRSFYAIGKDSVVPDEKLEAIIKQALKHSPSAFNSQSGRIVLLLGTEHDSLWNMAKDILKAMVPPESYPPTEAKLDSFKAGRGTVLFYEDQDTVKGLQEKYPLYKDNFPVWSLQSSGMLQYAIWMLLEDLGYGASLQHYNPLIDSEAATKWGIPASWKLLGEMPFGKPVASPDAKSFLPVDERLKIFR